MKSFNPVRFRGEFPALDDGAVYLDSAATALKPRSVISATNAFYSSSAGSVHRSQHLAAQALTANFESARQQVARFLNASDASQIIWTRGTTESINLVAQCYLRPRLQPGDQIIVSEAEHHANLIPWQIVARQCGAEVVKLPVDRNHIPDIKQLSALLSSKTRMLALGQMSNVTGGMPDLAQAVELAHRAGIPVMVDGAQGIVHSAIDVQALDIDFYAFSAHKLYGPTGIGALYGKAELLESCEPWLGGGKMVLEVDFDGFTLQPLPQRLEAGTPNIAGAIGLSAALTLLEETDLAAAETWSCQLADEAERLLSAHRGFISYRSPGSSLLAFNFQGIHYADMVTLISNAGVAIRAGQHCAQPLHRALGTSGSLRASFAPYNNHQDVIALNNAVSLALELLQDD